MKIFICGSANPRINPKYLEGINEIADFMLSKNIGIICVSSSFGSIAEMYNNYEKNKGQVDLIQPRPYAHEIGNMKGDTITQVENLYSLQQIALKDSDATLVLPGGNGTLAELYMITDGIKSKFDTDPVIIYNCNGFYDKVKEMNDFLMEAGVMEKYQYNYFNFCNTPQEVIKALKKNLKLK